MAAADNDVPPLSEEEISLRRAAAASVRQYIRTGTWWVSVPPLIRVNSLDAPRAVERGDVVGVNSRLVDVAPTRALLAPPHIAVDAADLATASALPRVVLRG